MQKYAAIAEAIKISRRNLYISQNQLANLSNYSRTTISMIEAGKRKPTDEFLIVLSNILNFDFITLAQKVENYQTLEHYLIANELLKYISLHDTYTISTLLDNEIVKKEFTYGEPLIIKEYCSILVFTHIDKDLSGAYSACVKLLNIDTSHLETFKPKLNMPDQYYSAIQSLVCIFSMQKCYSKQKTICFILVDFLEQNYFNNIVPVTSIDVFYRKYYVVTLNNLADAYFSSNEYSEALTVCEKAINQCFTLDTNYAIFALLKLKVEILYNLNELTESKKTYNEFSVFCQIAKYHTYFENSTNKFKKIYPELFLNYVEK